MRIDWHVASRPAPIFGRQFFSFCSMSRAAKHHVVRRRGTSLSAGASDAAACAGHECDSVVHSICFKLYVKTTIMAYDDLRDFIRALEKNGELKRIPFEVDPAPGDHRVRRPRGEDTAARRCCSRSPRAPAFRC